MNGASYLTIDNIVSSGHAQRGMTFYNLYNSTIKDNIITQIGCNGMIAESGIESSLTRGNIKVF